MRASPLGRERGERRRRGAPRRRRAPRAGSSASTPRACARCSGFVAHVLASGTWWARNVPSTGDAVDIARARPALRRAQHDRGPARRGLRTPAARASAWIARISSCAASSAAAKARCTAARVVAVHEVRVVAVPGEQRPRLRPRRARPSTVGPGDLVAVEVEDRQHRAVARGVQEADALPRALERRRSRPRRRRRRRRRGDRGCRTPRRTRGRARSRARRPRGSSPGVGTLTWLGTPPGVENWRKRRAGRPRPASPRDRPRE